MSLPKELIENYKNIFNENRSEFGGNPQVRESALNKFELLGFPTQKHEDWRFTNFNFLFKNDFELSLKPNEYEIDFDSPEMMFDKTKKNNFIVLLDGFFSKKLSKLTDIDNSIEIMPINQLFNQQPELYSKYNNENSNSLNNGAFSALNTAFAGNGFYIKIPDNLIYENPIYLIYLNDAQNKNIMSFPRNLIIAKEKSNVKFIEIFISLGDNLSFFNLHNDIILNESAIFDICCIQNDTNSSHILANTHFEQNKDSILNSTTISLNGKFIRNEIFSTLNDEGCQTNLNGLYNIQNDNFVENRTSINHAKPNCSSNELYKGILNNKSRGVFSGKIIVQKDAQKTLAYQSNRNILLTNDASINTKPQLEIFADDVKCSHGATTGYLDMDALFYLKTRGIDEEHAKALLLNAFASEVIDKISVEETRNYVKSKISSYLKIEDIDFGNYFENMQ